jgi:hypothetical protein
MNHWTTREGKRIPQLAELIAEVERSGRAEDGKIRAALRHAALTGDPHAPQAVRRMLGSLDPLVKDVPAELIRPARRPITREGLFFGFDVFGRAEGLREKELSERHVLLEGPTGSGKSSALRLILAQFITQTNVGIVVFDRKNEHSPLLHLDPSFEVVRLSELANNLWVENEGVPADFHTQLAIEGWASSTGLMAARMPFYECLATLRARGEPPRTPNLIAEITRRKSSAARSREHSSQIVDRLLQLRRCAPAVDCKRPFDVVRASTSRIIVKFDVASPAEQKVLVSNLILRFYAHRLHHPRRKLLHPVIVVFEEARTILDPSRAAQDDFGLFILIDLLAQSRELRVAWIAIESIGVNRRFADNIATKCVMAGDTRFSKDDSLAVLPAAVRAWCNDAARGTPGRAFLSTPDDGFRLIQIPYFPLPPYEAQMPPAPSWLRYDPDELTEPTPAIPNPLPPPERKTEEGAPKSGLDAIAVQMAIEIGRNPYATLGEISKHLKITPNKRKQILETLQRLGLIQILPLALKAGRGRPASVVEPTEQLLTTFDLARPRGRGSSTAKALTHRLGRAFAQRGAKVRLEHEIGNRHPVDLFVQETGKKDLAVELELHPNEHAIVNLTKLLEAGFDNILFLTFPEKLTLLERRLGAVALSHGVHLRIESVFAHLADMPEPEEEGEA